MPGIAERIRDIARPDQAGRTAAPSNDVLREAADALEAAKARIEELTAVVAGFVALTDIGRMRDFAEVKRTLAHGRALLADPPTLAAHAGDLSLRLRALANRSGHGGHDRIDPPRPVALVPAETPDTPAAVAAAAEPSPAAERAPAAPPVSPTTAGRDIPIGFDGQSPAPPSVAAQTETASTELAETIDRLLAKSRDERPIVATRPADPRDTTSDEIAFTAPPAANDAGPATRAGDKMDTVLAEIEAILRKPT